MERVHTGSIMAFSTGLGRAVCQPFWQEFDCMKETITFLIIIGVWFVLQAYILPKLGVST